MLVTAQAPRLSGTALAELETEWRALEERAPGSFFQSWSWIGCHAAERFDAPLLIRAVAGGVTVGLALFNRRSLPLARRALWLHQTGDPAKDSVFIEQNGPLVAGGHAAAGPAILREAVRRGGSVVLSGVQDGVLAWASGLGRVSRPALRQAPYATLAGRDGAGWLAARGSSTRSQLRRSRSRLETLGPVCLRRATSVAEAGDFLDELARMHQAAWTSRGQPGAFAEPAFRRFHAGLVERGVPRGEVALWRLGTGTRALGYLYNFEWRGHVLAYQSGFDLEAVPRASPGLVAHAMAIEAAASAGFERYDFLAGDMRFKRELGDASYAQHWVEVASTLHTRGLYRVARDRVTALVTGRRSDAGPPMS